LGLHRRSIRRRILLLVLIPILSLLGRYTFAVSSAAITGSASAQEKQAFAALRKEMAGRSARRARVAGLAISRPPAMNGYTSIIAAAGVVLNQLLLRITSAPPDEHQRAVIGGTLTGLHRLDQPGGTRSES
jgi:tryptophan synthase alpha subunit